MCHTVPRYIFIVWKILKAACPQPEILSVRDHPRWEIQRKLRSIGVTKNSWFMRQGLSETSYDIVNGTSVELYLKDQGETDREATHTEPHSKLGEMSFENPVDDSPLPPNTSIKVKIAEKGMGDWRETIPYDTLENVGPDGQFIVKDEVGFSGIIGKCIGCVGCCAHLDA